MRLPTSTHKVNKGKNYFPRNVSTQNEDQQVELILSNLAPIGVIQLRFWGQQDVVNVHAIQDFEHGFAFKGNLYKTYTGRRVEFRRSKKPNMRSHQLYAATRSGHRITRHRCPLQ